jgi:hypothetical protein
MTTDRRETINEQHPQHDIAQQEKASEYADGEFYSKVGRPSQTSERHYKLIKAIKSLTPPSQWRWFFPPFL